MPVIDVDKSTFAALHLSQAAVAFTRANLLYGSANQASDLRNTRSGGSSGGQSLPRLDAVRDSIKKLLALPSVPLATVGLDSGSFVRGIETGLALYYKAGNCGEHAGVVFSFLCTLGYPGLTIHYASSTVMDHAFCLIEWPSCDNFVVADAWPSKAQACRWSEFFAKPSTPRSDRGYAILASHTITDANMGLDVVGHAFQAIDPEKVAKLPLESRTKGFASQDIEDFIKRFLGQGIYNQIYTVTATSQPYQDYRFVDHDHKDQVNLLSTTAPPTEQWSGKILPVIQEVTGRLGQSNPGLLNTSMRYTGTRME
jgi:hypothetical protein